MMLEEYGRWKRLAKDAAVQSDLERISSDREQIEDSFYQHLKFGTGGLRGVLGAGTNRMNVYTVLRATRGLASYLLKKDGKKVAIGYDTRINSSLFAEITAKAVSKLGIEAFVYSEPLPTPMLSYAVRELGCDAGVMITASHNPSNYNGYKVYGSDGCQITDTAADAILAEINSLDYFGETVDFLLSDTESDIKINYISESLFDKYISRVSETSHLFGDEANKNISIVYTPLNGTGYRPVTQILLKNGYLGVTVVKEQAMPNGNFPTCPYPNPEIADALKLGIKYAKEQGAKILLATDPDCDRVGVAVKKGASYKILTGNEVGILLFNYICEKREKKGKMPALPIAVKTIVTTDLAKEIAEKYGVKIIDVLTGFKYIGEKIGELEAKPESGEFIFGFEESCGYLGGDYVRDKDGVYASYLIAEMTAYYDAQGISLCDKLEKIYGEHGYAKTSLYSYSFDGAVGYENMQSVMQYFRGGVSSFDGISVTKAEDYLQGLCGLPKSNVIKFFLENSSSVVIRPSGTEPKLKIYLSVTAESEGVAESITEKIKVFCENIIKQTK